MTSTPGVLAFPSHSTHNQIFIWFAKIFFFSFFSFFFVSTSDLESLDSVFSGAVCCGCCWGGGAVSVVVVVVVVGFVCSFSF